MAIFSPSPYSPERFKRDLRKGRERRAEKKAEQQAAESQTPEQAPYDDKFADMTNNYGDETEHPLGEQEGKAANQDQAANAAEQGTASADTLGAAEEKPEEGGFYNPGKKKEKVKGKFRFGGFRRKHAYVGFGVGGIITIGVAFWSLIPPLKVPAFLDGVRIGIPSGMIMRYIVEKTMTNIIFKFAIAEAEGRSSAKPGSFLDKLHKAFRESDLLGKMEKRNGIKFGRVGDAVHLFHHGKDLGMVRGPTDVWKQTIKLPELRRSVLGITRITFPFARIFDATNLARFIRSEYRLNFGTPPYDEPKDGESEADARKRNLRKLAEQRIRTILERIIGAMPAGIGCITGTSADCDKLVGDKQPRDTIRGTSGSPIDGAVGTGTDSDNISIEGVGDTAADTFQETLGEVTDVASDAVDDAIPGSFIDRFTEKLIALIIKVMTAKVAIGSIPAVGQIDTLAQIDHAVSQAISKKILQRTIILLKAQAYGGVAGLWLGYADEIKEGSMHWSYNAALAEDLTGADLAATAKYLYGGDPNEGVHVDPIVGSNLDDPLGDALDIIYGRVGLIIRLPLTLWYGSVSQALGIVGEFGGTVMNWALRVSGITGDVEEIMVGLFGPNWKERFAIWAADAIMELFGIKIEPLAHGPQLANNIYVGVDVINNTFLETNLGAVEQSPRDNLYSYLTAKDDYQYFVASLPLKDRLFSTDLPSSMINRLAVALPATPSPRNIASTLLATIQSLPSNFMSIFSGRTGAKDLASSASLDGVAQFGLTPDEVDLEPPPEITDVVLGEGEMPECPANEEGVVNTCQRYKEIISSAFCQFEDCPQLQE
jgi:hypothetical protein